jgi:hypothetical protein
VFSMAGQIDSQTTICSINAHCVDYRIVLPSSRSLIFSHSGA